MELERSLETRTKIPAEVFSRTNFATENEAKGFSGSIKKERLQLSKDIPAAYYALKVLDTKNKRIEEEFKRETRVYEKIVEVGGHPNICKYFGSTLLSPHFIITLECAHNDAFSILLAQTSSKKLFESKPFPSAFWLKVCYDAAVGLEFLHKLEFYHRDFHLQNLLVFLGNSETEPITKIADFGGALHKDDKPISFCGHRKLSAPEVLIQRKNKLLSNYTFASDVYMFGMMLYEVLHGSSTKRIFPQLSETAVMEKIIKGDRPNIERGNECHPDILRLMKSCWSQQAKLRPNMSDVVKVLASVLKERSTKGPLFHPPKKNNTKSVHHTRHLYLNDEVMSVLQKSIRRGNPEDAMYWAAELDSSGSGKQAMDRLTVIASEDVSMSIPGMPIFVFNMFQKWNQLQKTSVHEARKILLKCAATLARVPKCRAANNACGASLYFVQQKIEEAKTSAAARGLVAAPKKMNNPIQYLRDLMDKAIQDPKTEPDALFMLQRLYMESKSWETKIWDMILAFPTKHEITKQAITCLHSLTIPDHIGGDSGCRLRLFHAFLLCIREPFLKMDATVPDVEINDETVRRYYEPVGLAGRHPEGIPDYAVDRHNARGKGGGNTEMFCYGQDTSQLILSGAQYWKIDISSWSKEEIAKSHGPGKRFFKNQMYGLPTLLSQFFDEGSWVHEEYLPQVDVSGEDTNRARAKQFYLTWEMEHGSLKAKSVHITSHQQHLIAQVLK